MQVIQSPIYAVSVETYPQSRAAGREKSDAKSNNTETPDTERTNVKAAEETFSFEEQRQIQALKARDSEVRAHERAHMNVARGIATSGASFTYQAGPDGKRYAIGGEVQIDISPVPGDPEATLRKAETIRRAALAPASPSSQDHSVAASAAGMAITARIELLQQNQQSNDSHRSAGSLGTRIDIRA